MNPRCQFCQSLLIDTDHGLYWECLRCLTPPLKVLNIKISQYRHHKANAVIEYRIPNNSGWFIIDSWPYKSDNVDYYNHLDGSCKHILQCEHLDLSGCNQREILEIITLLIAFQ